MQDSIAAAYVVGGGDADDLASAFGALGALANRLSA
jgi:hypothetical protein